MPEAWAECLGLELSASRVNSPAGPAVVFADGMVYRLRRPLSADTLRALVRTQGDPRVRRDDLVRDGRYLSE